MKFKTHQQILLFLFNFCRIAVTVLTFVMVWTCCVVLLDWGTGFKMVIAAFLARWGMKYFTHVIEFYINKGIAKRTAEINNDIDSYIEGLKHIEI